MRKRIVPILALVAISGWGATIILMYRFGELERELAAANANRVALAESKKQSDTDLRILEAESGRLGVLRNELAAARNAENTISQQVAQKKTELKDLLQKIEVNRVELDALEPALLEGREEVKNIKQQIQSAENELAALRAKLQQSAEEARRTSGGAYSAIARPERGGTARESGSGTAKRGKTTQSGTIAALPGKRESEVTDIESEAMKRFKIVDLNGDGIIDGTELRVKEVAVLSLIDRNLDRYITPDEALASAEELARLDKDGDGKISSLEFTARNIIKVLDANGDGVLAFEEYLDILNWQNKRR
jgi:Ca2+-binding EF-hand superfamily protein